MNWLILRSLLGIWLESLARLLLVLSIGLGVAVLTPLGRQWLIPTDDPNNTQYISAIIGAMVGGVITLVASIALSKSDRRGRQASRKKSSIYMPLYDEISEFLGVVQTNRFPKEINITGDYRGYWNIPVFEIWKKVEGDSRVLSLPPHIRKHFKSVMHSIDEYLQGYKSSEAEFSPLLAEVFQTTLDAKPLFTNWGESVFTGFMNDSDSPSSLFPTTEVTFNSDEIRKITDGEKQKFLLALRTKTDSLESIKNLRRLRDSLLSELMTAKVFLEWAIKYIERKYENGVNHI